MANQLLFYLEYIRKFEELLTSKKLKIDRDYKDNTAIENKLKTIQNIRINPELQESLSTIKNKISDLLESADSLYLNDSIKNSAYEVSLFSINRFHNEF